MSQKGLLFYFDGPDGVGKTAQMELAATALQAAGHKVFTTRTMGGTPIGELLRDALLSDTVRPVKTDLHIALAAQYALAEEVEKHRQAGEIVLIDRSPLSIIGYQMYGDGLDGTVAYEATGELLDLFQPDLIIVYWAESTALQERRRSRNHLTGHDYFENKSNEFHLKVAEGFAAAASHFGAKVVDANGTVEKVHDSTMLPINQILA